MKMKLILYTLVLGLTTQLISQTRLKAVGDIMMGSYTPFPKTPANNGQVFIDSISSHLDSADITFGNLEGVFVTKELKPQKCREESRKAGRCYEFGMPDSLSYTLRALNFDLLSFDNNHVSDYGIEGINHTKGKLDTLDIQYGYKKSPVIFKRDSTTFALIPFGTSSVSWRVTDLKFAQEVISKYDTLVDVVIVSFHGGAEGYDAQHTPNHNEKFYGEDRGNLIAFSHTAIDAGADLILGHGPHVLRGIEVYKNKLICYSMGNFLTHGNVSIRGVKGCGVIMDIIIDNNSGNFISGKIIPTKQTPPGIPYYDKKGESIQLIKKLSEEDFSNSQIKVLDSGELIYK